MKLLHIATIAVFVAVIYLPQTLLPQQGSPAAVDIEKIKSLASDLIKPQSKSEREKVLAEVEKIAPKGAPLTKSQFEELEKTIRTSVEYPKADTGAKDYSVSIASTKQKFPIKVYISSAYKEDKPTPLIIVIHGGPVGPMNMALAQAGKAMASWQPSAENNGWLVCCTVEATDVTGELGSKALFEIIDYVKEHYNVDPDRVYMTGQSRGGFFSWGYGLADPDRFAGIAPDCGGGFQGDKLINAANLSVYNVQGKQDNQGNQNFVLPRMAKQNKDKLDELAKKEKGKYEHIYKETELGHTWNSAVYPDVMKWFSTRPRDNYVKRVIGHIGALGSNNRLYWFQVLDGRDTPVEAECDRARNEVNIKCDGLKKFRVYLHDKLLDLDRNIKIIVNGKTAFEGKVTRSPYFTLKHITDTNDTGRVFAQMVEVEVK
ncbi:MAG: hypothetical protein A2W23_03420 [Planctomycetes bacterium RBG_16_43_13]|nr:MAG: hypothetical protein A2W23_03420 [Planctomycetes bacterium RBG_16_43_13]